jgi:hypothetical protein
MIRSKIGPSDYYDMTPLSNHGAGDVWTGLPSYGVLAEPVVRGIVITPACDLSNRKVESLTYLPIIPIAAYFTTFAFVPTWTKTAAGLAEQAGLNWESIKTGLFTPPPIDVLDSLRRQCGDALKVERQPEKHKVAIQRCVVILDILQMCSAPGTKCASTDSVVFALGEKSYRDTVRRIVTNSQPLDVHFLPPDRQAPEWSAVPYPSVALFRYPFTASLELLDDAQDVTVKEWDGVLAKYSSVLPSTAAFSAERPMKRATVKPRFMSDLLTRYVGLHVRLGSPDFTEATVEEYVSEVRSI